MAGFGWTPGSERGGKVPREGGRNEPFKPSVRPWTTLSDHIDVRELPDVPRAGIPPTTTDLPKRVGEAATGEATGIVEGTFRAFGAWLIQRFADAHGVGLLLRAAKWAVKIVRWVGVSGGRGGIDVALPIPLGSGVELQLSAHVGKGSGAHELPLTVCFAPGDDSPVGALQIGRFEIDPAAGSAEDWQALRTISKRSVQHMDTDLAYFPSIATESDTFSPIDMPLSHVVEVVPVDLSGALQVREPGMRVAALKRAAEQQLLPQFRSQLETREGGIMVGYDSPSGLLLWLRLDEDGQPSRPAWRIEIEVDPATGRLIRVRVRAIGPWGLHHTTRSGCDR